MSTYDHREIDRRWQKTWADDNTFATPTDRTRPKFYILDMFPYPSGSGLHVGHPKGYVATDVVARAKRMMGFNVLRPMGWDSFGLPTERQAVREGKHPREITERNVARFKEQLSQIGLSYDWSRELATSDESFYKWTQWIFLKLYHQGLAYQADVPVNWCPALGTVLSNEEVHEGRYKETGDLVEQRLMKQWMLKIPEYADRLLAGLDDVDWPESTRKKQIEWIGKSYGADVRFAVKGASDGAEVIEVYTTRPDTLFGGTYMVLAPEHPLVDQLTTDEQREAVAAYRAEVAQKSERDRISEAACAVKTGVFTGSYAINPVNDAEIPIWIADYVLASYGTGAVFACPAGDERDHAFAKQFDLPIIEVVDGGEASDIGEAAYTGDGPHINSEFLNGLNNEQAIAAIIEWLEERGRGEGRVRYKLRDWLFSRQRYWGEPFPVVFDSEGNPHPLPESALPLTLPHVDEFKPTEDGQPPLARAEDWVHTTHPKTGEPATRETNTMPQWAGSCWYYLRFISPHLDDKPWDPEEEKYWMPVDLYVGGDEHAVLHLLYARFWHQVLYDLKLVSTPEPFTRLFHQGMIHAQSYQDENKKYYYAEQVEERDGKFFVKDTGAPVTTRLEKMSKSRYNVVNPDDMCEEYGADAMRLYELFMGPLEDGNEWDTSGVAGTRRFLDRVWRFAVNHGGDGPSDKVVDREVDDPVLERALHKAIKKVTEAVAQLRFNTAIAEMMVFANEATKAAAIPRAWIDSFIAVLSPFAPHVSSEIWKVLGHSEGLAYAPWPAFDESKIAEETITIAVQVMGKTRSKIEVPADIDEAGAIAAAKADEKIARLIEGKTIRREIYVPGRLVNLVAN
jgi:leucyl-tRNA synthetase